MSESSGSPYGPFDRFMLLGKTNRDGSKSVMRLLSSNEKLSRFTIYCRKCHYGLCMHIEIGACMKSGKILNIIFVDPCPNCGTGEVLPYPEWIE